MWKLIINSVGSCDSTSKVGILIIQQWFAGSIISVVLKNLYNNE